MDFESLSLSERKIVVGIDFGTTYSGIAWAETKRPDRRTAITSWPISRTVYEGESSDKVPTKLYYRGTHPYWGFTIPVTVPDRAVIEWFKLDLDPSLGPVSDTGLPKKPRSSRLTQTLVTDYISALVEHLMFTLNEKLGNGVVRSTPLEFVVTVPAIWSDKAKDATKKACQQAPSIAATNAPIHLISEPEAAAIYALHGLDPHGLSVGDSFVICDAGGGTVDLISYTITSLKPILEVREAAPGTGGLCGSTYLNRRFSSFLWAKLGQLNGFDDELMAEAMDRFDKTIKRQFTTTAALDETYAVPVGGLADNRELGIRRGRYALRASDLQTIFEPVIQEVVKLVQGQIASSGVPISTVLLVGGFGASNYLKERLRTAVGSGVNVLQPPNAWLAVAQGAVMKGLAQCASPAISRTIASVTGRKARKHYGVELWVEYDATIHSQVRHTRKFCGYRGCMMVLAMWWLIRRGDTVKENKPIRFHYWYTRPVSQGPQDVIGSTIYMDQLSAEAPIGRNSSNVQALCGLRADISGLEPDMAEGSDGNMYYRTHCQIESLYLSASTKYTLIHKGKRYDTVTAEYV